VLTDIPPPSTEPPSNQEQNSPEPVHEPAHEEEQETVEASPEQITEFSGDQRSLSTQNDKPVQETLQTGM
jgi:hypothetical protein